MSCFALAGEKTTRQINIRLIDVGACFYHEYVGEVRLMEMGKLGARGTKRSVEKDFRFRGW